MSISAVFLPKKGEENPLGQTSCLDVVLAEVEVDGFLTLSGFFCFSVFFGGSEVVLPLKKYEIISYSRFQGYLGRKNAKMQN